MDETNFSMGGLTSRLSCTWYDELPHPSPPYRNTGLTISAIQSDTRRSRSPLYPSRLGGPARCTGADVYTGRHIQSRCVQLLLFLFLYLYRKLFHVHPARFVARQNVSGRVVVRLIGQIYGRWTRRRMGV